jgi:uncharacterized protein YceH (UPF0502 family)
VSSLDLTPPAARIIGALVEKQLTTPQQYPLTLNALMAACNQTSSRNPVVSYDERLVDTTLAGLKSRGLVRFVHPSHGRSVTRYRQVLEEVLHLETPELALMAVLLLRGPQTLAELRTRTERMADFADPRQVEETLEGLAARDEPLVARLGREPGRREERWAQLLAPDTAEASYERPEPPAGPVHRDPAAPAAPSLSSQVAVLQAEVAALRRDLDDLIARLGS